MDTDAGLFKNIVLGILGAIIGGAVFNALGLILNVIALIKSNYSVMSHLLSCRWLHISNCIQI